MEFQIRNLMKPLEFSKSRKDEYSTKAQPPPLFGFVKLKIKT